MKYILKNSAARMHCVGVDVLPGASVECAEEQVTKFGKAILHQLKASEYFESQGQKPELSLFVRDDDGDEKLSAKDFEEHHTELVAAAFKPPSVEEQIADLEAKLAELKASKE